MMADGKTAEFVIVAPADDNPPPLSAVVFSTAPVERVDVADAEAIGASVLLHNATTTREEDLKQCEGFRAIQRNVQHQLSTPDPAPSSAALVKTPEQSAAHRASLRATLQTVTQYIVVIENMMRSKSYANE